MPIPAGSTVARAGTLAATLGVVAAAACWGISAIMAKVAFEHGVPPDRMAQARAAVALLALAPLLAWRRRDLLRPPAGTLPLLPGFGGLDATGLAGGAASAVLFAAYLLTAEAAGRAGAQPATVLLWGFVAAVIAWSPISPWWSWPFAALRQPPVLLAVIGVGLVGTFEPVFAATFAWLLLGQHLRPVQLAGGLLVVAGVVLAQLAQPRLRPAGEPGQPAHADLHA